MRADWLLVLCPVWCNVWTSDPHCTKCSVWQIGETVNHKQTLSSLPYIYDPGHCNDGFSQAYLFVSFCYSWAVLSSVTARQKQIPHTIRSTCSTFYRKMVISHDHISWSYLAETKGRPRVTEVLFKRNSAVGVRGWGIENPFQMECGSHCGSSSVNINRY